MAVEDQPDQPGITRLLSTINSLMCLEETRGRGEKEEQEEEVGGGAEFQCVDGAGQPRMLFVLSADLIGGEQSVNQQATTNESKTSRPRAAHLNCFMRSWWGEMKGVRGECKARTKSNLPAHCSRSACRYYFPTQCGFQGCRSLRAARRWTGI